MLVSEAKNTFKIKIKIAGGLTPPSDAELSELFFEAMLQICTITTPRCYLKDAEIDTDEEVYRYISGGKFVTYPQKPLFDTEDESYDANVELLMDNDLNYAVIAKAAALYSKSWDNVQKFESEYNQWIANFKANFNKVAR